MRIAKPFYRRAKKSWYLQLGKRQISLAKDRKKAFEKWKQMLLHEGLATDPCLTIEELCDRFLEWAKHHTAEGTYEFYRTYLQQFCDAFGKRDVGRITIDDAERWLDSHETWKNASRRAAVVSVKRAYSWGNDRQIIYVHPLKGMKKPPESRREAILSEGDMKAIFAAARGKAFKNFLLAMEETGCRPGEIAGVTAEQVDLAQGVWVLPKHKTRHKTGKPRVVYLTPRMVELCRDLMAKYPEGPIFRTSRGKPWNRNAVRCRFRRLRDKLGLKGVVAYTYRHTYATDALVNGVDTMTVCELLGHTSPAMLMKHYGHLAK